MPSGPGLAARPEYSGARSADAPRTQGVEMAGVTLKSKGFQGNA